MGHQLFSFFVFIFFVFLSDPPVFAGGLKNASLLTEVATGSNRNLTCAVVDYQGPSPLTLNLTTEPGPVPGLKYKKTNSSSITVIITNATRNDTSAYVCHACSGKEYCSRLSFDTYVGGEKGGSVHCFASRLGWVGKLDM